MSYGIEHEGVTNTFAQVDVHTAVDSDIIPFSHTTVGGDDVFMFIFTSWAGINATAPFISLLDYDLQDIVIQGAGNGNSSIAQYDNHISGPPAGTKSGRLRLSPVGFEATYSVCITCWTFTGVRPAAFLGDNDMYGNPFSLQSGASPKHPTGDIILNVTATAQDRIAVCNVAYKPTSPTYQMPIPTIPRMQEKHKANSGFSSPTLGVMGAFIKQAPGTANFRWLDEPGSQARTLYGYEIYPKPAPAESGYPNLQSFY